MSTTWNPTRDEYYADSAVGSSALRDFLTSPLLYYERYVAKNKALEKKVTDAMDKGSLADLLLTEPEHVEALYRVTDLPRKNTKEWKAEEEAAGGRTLVKRKLWDEAEGIAEAVRSNALAYSLLSGSQQMCHKWTDASGVTCRLRIDSLTETRAGLAMVDLKVWSGVQPTRVAHKIGTPEEWDDHPLRTRAWNQGVYHQLALYERGLVDLLGAESVMWVLVVAPQDPPHEEVQIVQLDDDYQFLGRRDVDHALRDLGNRLRSPGKESWLPSYSQEIRQLLPPSWVTRKERP